MKVLISWIRIRPTKITAGPDPQHRKKCNFDKYKNVWLPADQLSPLSPGWGAAFPDFSTPVLYSMKLLSINAKHAVFKVQFDKILVGHCSLGRIIVPTLTTLYRTDPYFG